MSKNLKEIMKPQDVHVVVNAVDHVMTCFNHDGKKMWSIPAHCEGVNGPGFEGNGADTPPGLYEIGLMTKTQNDEPQHIWNSYGRWFCDLVELENQEASRGRAGCGIHGGGTGLADPLAPHQGWMFTHGCTRLQNIDLENTFVPTCQHVKSKNGRIFVEVVW